MELEKDKLYISFHKPKSLLGYLISLRTFGKYAHSELVYNDVVYLSNPGGIRKQKFEYKSNMDIYELDKNIDISTVLSEFKKLEGKGYDYLAILLSQLLELQIDSNDKYFCSELCIYLINKGLQDTLTFDLKEIKDNEFSPNKLYKYLKFMELIKEKEVM